jgi:hypothetical protein
MCNALNFKAIFMFFIHFFFPQREMFFPFSFLFLFLQSEEATKPKANAFEMKQQMKKKSLFFFLCMSEVAIVNISENPRQLER